MRWRDRVTTGSATTVSRTMLDLRVHVEPIVRLVDERCTARELLLRPVDGGDLHERVADAQVAMAWVTGFALESARALLEVPGPPIHINITPADLSRARFSELVEQAIGREQAPNLVLEITEQTELVASRRARRTLIELRRLGVRIAIDDYGDGWADVASLELVRPEIIKVRLARLADHQIAEEVRRHAAELHADVVVEQVETSADLALVRSLGFSHTQGWYWDAHGWGAGLGLNALP